MDELKQKQICAIYTRKSSDQGLEINYNSLEAQYDSARHYINAHAGEGWCLYDKQFSDGGFSGGDMERPGIKNLLREIELGRIDLVVVYKLDRLTRSLLDFAKLMEIFDRHKVGFVSVTESFNTATPMGRLTLNMILSFAQFEREMAGERIRDKVKASKRKGLWMGGTPPLGYDVKDRKLVVNKAEAKIVTFVYGEYLKHGSLTRIVEELDARCMRTKSWTTQKDRKRLGRKIDVNVVNRMLRNPLYMGMVEHQGQRFDGEHDAIIQPEFWDRVAMAIDERARSEVRPATKGNAPYLLRGLLYDSEGWAMTPGDGGKHGQKRYRYYISTKAIKHGYESTDIRSVSAEQIEPFVVNEIKQLFQTRELLAQIHEEVKLHDRRITLDQVRENLSEFGKMWGELFPHEQHRIVQLIIKRIQVGLDAVNITFQPNGIAEVYGQITGNRRAS